jgi:hypothetical protein
MIKIVALDLVIDNDLVGTYNFASKELAELFAQGIYENIVDDKKSVTEFRATEYSVCEDAEDMALVLGKAIGIDDDKINELIEEAKKPQ